MIRYIRIVVRPSRKSLIEIDMSTRCIPMKLNHRLWWNMQTIMIMLNVVIEDESERNNDSDIEFNPTFLENYLKNDLGESSNQLENNTDDIELFVPERDNGNQLEDI